MKKITILSLVVFHLFMVKSNGQTIIEQKGIIEKVIDNATGKTIPMDTIRKMIEKNHNLNFQPIINEYGNVGHYIYYENARLNIGESELRVKIGELFPPFVMKPVDNDSIYSSKLLGKRVYFARAPPDQHRAAR